jgi:hypothetical protein
VKEFGANMLLQKGNSAADRRWGAAELAAGPGKAAFVERRHKDFHGVEAVHGFVLLFFQLEE